MVAIMAASTAAQQPKFLEIAPEIRKLMYSYLLECPSCVVHFHLCCKNIKVSQKLPIQILTVCHQIYDEASSLVEEKLSDVHLLVDQCPQHQVTLAGNLSSQQRQFITKHGYRITEVTIKELRGIRLDTVAMISRCPNLGKLVVDCGWTVKLNAHQGDTAEYWLNSDEVNDWLWEEVFEVYGHWESDENDRFIGDDIWTRLAKHRLGRGRPYDIEVIACFDIAVVSKSMVCGVYSSLLKH